MPTSTPTLDEPGFASKPACGTPLPVLARIPWISADTPTSQEAAPESLATALTHFEYLLGEFGIGGEIDTDSLAPVPFAEATDFQSTSVQSERSESILTSIRPDIAPMPRRAFDWSELLLRIDSAVEPYTRAIVLLVLVTVGAFTMLLLRSPEAPLTPQAAPAPGTAQPLSEARTSAPSITPRDTTLSAAKETPAEIDSKPTASGPVGVRVEGEPPMATLSASLRLVPSDLESNSREYPSSTLPPSDTRSARLPEGENSTPTLK